MHMNNCFTLNVNRLTAPIKTHSVADQIKKKKNHLYTAYKRFTLGVKTQTKTERWKKVFHENGDQKKTGTAILR